MRKIQLLVTWMLSVAFAAMAQKTPESLLGAAVHQEEVKGDLKGAISAYQKVMTAPGAGRKTVAEALFRIAQCYEKLGNAESRRIYERLIREYADQHEVAASARGRLTALRSSSEGARGIVMRQVWASPNIDLEGTVSADGRYISFPGPESGTLSLHDLISGDDQILTRKSSSSASEHAEDSAVSRDGKHVAYTWLNSNQQYELRLVGVGGGDTPRVLYSSEVLDWIGPYDWSPDGDSIAVRCSTKDRIVQIATISVRDGKLRVLKSLEWRGFSNLLYSPDGKYLAYDLPASETTEQRDIFLLAGDGSRETALIRHPADDTVLGWTPDGTHLLFASDRGGSRGLWSIPVANGEGIEGAKLIKPDIGDARGRGVTRNGVLYLGLRTDGPEVYVAHFDFAAGKLLRPPEKPIQELAGSHRMAVFSPDGRRLAYQIRRDQPSNVIAVRDLESGKTRQFSLDLVYFQQPEWLPDGRSISMVGTDKKGRRGIFKADVETGAVVPVMFNNEGSHLIWHDWSPDGRLLYYHRAGKEGVTLIARDLASTEEREIMRGKGVSFGRVSRDGKSVILLSNGRTDLKVAPINGGESRDLVRLARGERFWQVEWMPDGQSLLALKAGPAGRELLHISLNGRGIRKLDFNADGLLYPNVHPDGSRLAFTRGQMKREVWAVENFLPVLRANQ